MQTVANYVDNDVRENFAIQGLAQILKNHVLIMIDGKGHSEASSTDAALPSIVRQTGQLLLFLMIRKS